MIGEHEHDAIRHFLIRQPSGGSCQIPDWMFDPAANGLAIVSVLRIPNPSEAIRNLRLFEEQRPKVTYTGVEVDSEKPRLDAGLEIIG